MSFNGLSRLFKDVQLQRIFPDGKIFADCSPKISDDTIARLYEEQKDNPGFDLKQFILDHFEIPIPHSDNYSSDQTRSTAENIEQLWDVLSREPDTGVGSLIPLPFPYIVPGGRFGEIYYWDSYFTMLGLQVSGRYQMIENMIRNFAWLIDRFGYIPNGNRSYYLGRSQPPFFTMMLQLLGEINGPGARQEFLPQLEKEYLFWMKGFDSLSEKNKASRHVVRLPGGSILQRYWDENGTPRPESYREDCNLAAENKETTTDLYRHLRAGAESGWDFSSRWFRDGKHLGTIHTTDIIPVDLNCLLYHTESALAAGFEKLDPGKAGEYQEKSASRLEAIRRYCWNEPAGFYTDYDFAKGERKNELTLAGLAPLFFGVATVEQAVRIQEMLRKKFLKPGGLVTTLVETGEQWDAPNGWAPLQWMAVKGLSDYGYQELALEIAQRWIRLNDEVFRRTGKLMEKYNVVDMSLEAGGGEYTGQDGFGWTNGVYLALQSFSKKIKA